MPQKLSWAFCLAACLVQLSLACWYPTALYCRGSFWTLWWLLRLNSTTTATLSLSNSRIKVHLSHSELSFRLNFISVPLDYLLFNLCARRCDRWCDNGNYLPTIGFALVLTKQAYICPIVSNPIVSNFVQSTLFCGLRLP